MFRSKANWAENGEKCTKYFLNLEKIRYNGKTCRTILKDDNTLVTDDQQILAEQEEYYRELYRKDNSIKFEINNTYGVHLPENLATDFAEEFSQEEVHCALKNMKHNRTPGPDGLPAEFLSKILD